MTCYLPQLYFLKIDPHMSSPKWARCRPELLGPTTTDFVLVILA